jgi:hypothetical protein
MAKGSREHYEPGMVVSSATLRDDDSASAPGRLPEVAALFREVVARLS